MGIKTKIKKFLNFFLKILYPTLYRIEASYTYLELLKINIHNSKVSDKAKIYGPAQINKSTIGEYTYIASNCNIKNTTIGKFCSIGTNLVSGYGIHPTNALSTSPMFYSTKMQNGVSLSLTDKIEELKEITVGHDVFIGMNVTILDGITIGDGAVIGAGAVVSKNIPPYSIAVGSPINIIKYRFDENVIEELNKIKWWNFKENELLEVERYFNDVEGFIKKYSPISK